MKTTKNIRLTVTIGLLAPLALAACGTGSGTSQGDDRTIAIGVASLPLFAPVFVADSKGYFEDEGLDVQLEPVQTGADAIPLLSAGRLDAAAAGFSAGIFNALDSGLNFTIVGSMGIADGTDFSPAHLVVRQQLVDDNSVQNITDLSGLKVGVAGGPGGAGAYLAGLALESEGLTLGDVELVNIAFPDMPAALENGGVDAALMTSPFSDTVLNDGVGTSFWYPPKATTATGLMFGEQFSQSDDAQPFFDALVRASKELQGDARYDEAYLQIVADAIGQPVEAISGIPLNTWDPKLAPPTDQLSAMERIWMNSGVIDYSYPLDPATYIDPTFSTTAQN